MGHIGVFGAQFTWVTKMGHIWGTTSIFGNMDSDVINFGAKLVWKYRGICVNGCGNQGKVGDKYGENLGKYHRGISEKLGKNWVWQLGEISGKFGANLGEISVGIGTEI